MKFTKGPEQQNTILASSVMKVTVANGDYEVYFPYVSHVLPNG